MTDIIEVPVDFGSFYEKMRRLNEVFIREMGIPGILEVKVSRRLFQILVDQNREMLSFSAKGNDAIEYNWLEINFSHGALRIFPEEAKE